MHEDGGAFEDFTEYPFGVVDSGPLLLLASPFCLCNTNSFILIGGTVICITSQLIQKHFVHYYNINYRTDALYWIRTTATLVAIQQT